MMTNLEHPLVQDYLSRLRAQAAALLEGEARELVADIEEHFVAAERQGRTSEADIRTLLDRLGTPESVVAAAAPPAPPAPAGSGIPRREGMTVMLLIVAEVLVLTVLLAPIGIIVWLVGLVMLVLCRRWNTTQRAQAWIVLASGVPVALLALAAIGMTAYTDMSCAPDGSNAATCDPTASAPPAWVPWLVGLLGIGFGLLQVVIARRLLAAVGEHGPAPKGLRMR